MTQLLSERQLLAQWLEWVQVGQFHEGAEQIGWKVVLVAPDALIEFEQRREGVEKRKIRHLELDISPLEEFLPRC